MEWGCYINNKSHVISCYLPRAIWAQIALVYSNSTRSSCDLLQKNISFYHLEKYFSHLTLALEHGELMTRWCESLTLTSSNSFITAHTDHNRDVIQASALVIIDWCEEDFKNNFPSWGMSHESLWRKLQVCRASICLMSKWSGAATIISLEEEEPPGMGKYFSKVMTLKS